MANYVPTLAEFTKTFAREKHITVEQAQGSLEMHKHYEDISYRRRRNQTTNIPQNVLQNQIPHNKGVLVVGSGMLLKANNKLMYFQNSKYGGYPVDAHSQYGIIVDGVNQRKFVSMDGGDNINSFRPKY